MKSRWIMGLGGLAVVLLIVAGTAVGAAMAARGGSSSRSQSPTAAVQQAETKPWLGIIVVMTPNGVTVGQVIADGPSDDVLNRGDIIKAVDGVAVANVKELRQQLKDKAVANTLNLSIARDNQTLSVSLTLGQRPPPLVQHPRPTVERPKLLPELQDIPKDQLFGHILGGQLNLRDATGNPLTVNIVLGTLTDKRADSVKVKPNDGSSEKTYQVTENTLGHRLLERLETGAKVMVVTVGGSSEARLVAPGGLRHRWLGLPSLGRRHVPLHLKGVGQ